jgi:hypothetical protein
MTMSMDKTAVEQYCSQMSGESDDENDSLEEERRSGFKGNMQLPLPKAVPEAAHPRRPSLHPHSLRNTT